MKTPLHILHLEDDPMDAEIIHETLAAEKITFDIQRVDTSDEYKEALDHGNFDLILSDFKMPAFDGISALSIAKKLHPDIPFIFVSATIGEERAIDAVQLGATDYVLKDRLNRLGPSVRRALAEAEERKKRLKAERQLRESEERFRLIAENMADLVAVLDLEGKRLYNSPSYETLLGSPESLRGTDSFSEVHPDDKQRIITIFHDTVKTGVGHRTEYRIVNKDGEIKFVESQGSVIKDDAGKPAKVIVISRDISERKLLEEQLLHAQKMESIGTLAGGIAHDFNNVLGIVLGYLSIIARGNVEPERLSKSVEAMNAAVKRGAGLVRQLLTFARKSEVLFSPTHVNGTIKEVADMCSQTFPKTISVLSDLDTHIPAIIADPNQLHQALLNLCVNARDAMPNGGVLSVSSKVVHKTEIKSRLPDATFDSYVRVSVADTGTGMDAATQARIFEPFFTTKGVGKGTGLGLAMVYGIINTHRGLIDVKSIVGKGTAFHLYFPITTAGDNALDLAEATAKNIKGGTETILVVEDERDQVVLINSLLVGFGYRVLAAYDGIEAVDVFRKHSAEIALVVTDLGLPRLGGWDAFLQMKEIKSGIPCIIATGYIDAKSRSNMLKTGARDFIQKPYEATALLKKVRDVLDSVKS